jgi:hypothetical protein
VPGKLLSESEMFQEKDKCKNTDTKGTKLKV